MSVSDGPLTHEPGLLPDWPGDAWWRDENQGEDEDETPAE